MYQYEYASQFPRVALFVAVVQERNARIFQLNSQLVRIWQIRDIGRSSPRYAGGHSKLAAARRDMSKRWY